MYEPQGHSLKNGLFWLKVTIIFLLRLFVFLQMRDFGSVSQDDTSDDDETFEAENGNQTDWRLCLLSMPATIRCAQIQLWWFLKGQDRINNMISFAV